MHDKQKKLKKKNRNKSRKKKRSMFVAKKENAMSNQYHH